MFRISLRIGLVNGTTLEYDAREYHDSLDEAERKLVKYGEIIDSILLSNEGARLEIATADHGIAIVPKDAITFVERSVRHYPAGLARPDLSVDVWKDLQCG